MSKFLIAACILLGAGSGMQRAAGQPSQVIEHDELRALGISRLSDLLRYAEGIRFTTIDAFSPGSSMGGRTTFSDVSPEVLVDGHPVEIGPFYSESLSLLGLPVETIDRVEIIVRPALVEGLFADRGVIRIQTRKPGTPFRLDAAVAASNEVGDPGPFRDGGAANIDTQGPDATISAEWGTQEFGVRTAAVYRRHYYTKPVLLRRLSGLHDVSTAPVSEVLAPSLSMGWGRNGLSAEVLVAGVGSRLYPYLPLAAREVALDHRAVNASAEVVHRFPAGGLLRHRLTASVRRSREAQESSVPFLWEHDRLVARSAWTGTSRSLRLGIGGAAGYERAAARAGADRGWGEAFASIGTASTRKVQFEAAGLAATDGGDVALKSIAEVGYSPGRGHRLQLYLSAVHPLSVEMDPKVYWLRRGIRPAALPAEVDLEDEEFSLRLSSDLEWRWADEGIAFTGGAGIRHFMGYGVARLLQSDPDSIAGLGFTQSDGTIGAAWVRLETGLLGAKQRLFAGVSAPLAGDDPFSRAWDAVPDTRYGVWFYLPVASDFQAQARIDRQSGSTWHDFGSAARVDGVTMVDLALYKRVADGRLHLRFGISNLLRRKMKFHPLGDTFDLTARIDIRLQLGTSR